MLLFAVVFYTAPLTVIWLVGWYRMADFAAIDWDPIREVTLANVICVIFVTHVYETVFLIKARESDLVRVERLERARTQAELDALKSQIDPHFLFNSLNTLHHLIDTEPDRARAFNENLARVYRYILQSRDRPLVLLSQEKEFLASYVHLLELRFGESLRVVEDSDPRLEDRYLIPPISLQILVENAVKHNQFNARQPMEIAIEIRDGRATVSNPRRPKELLRPTSGTGLANLGERYKLATA